MMRNWLHGVALGAVLFGVSTAFGGTIQFSSASPSDTVTAGTTISVAAELTSVTLPFHAAQILIGSNAATDLDFPSFDSTWSATFPSLSVTYDRPDVGGFLQEVYLEADNQSPSPEFATSFDIGTLTIDTTGMTNGNYSVIVDSTDSAVILYGEEIITESIGGSFNFTIVPEPATLALMALGAAALIRRRTGS